MLLMDWATSCSDNNKAEKARDLYTIETGNDWTSSCPRLKRSIEVQVKVMFSCRYLYSMKALCHLLDRKFHAQSYYCKVSKMMRFDVDSRANSPMIAVSSFICQKVPTEEGENTIWFDEAILGNLSEYYDLSFDTKHEFYGILVYALLYYSTWHSIDYFKKGMPWIRFPTSLWPPITLHFLYGSIL